MVLRKAGDKIVISKEGVEISVERELAAVTKSLDLTTEQKIAEQLGAASAPLDTKSTPESIAALSVRVRDSWSSLQGTLKELAASAPAGAITANWQNHHKMLDQMYELGLLNSELEKQIRGLLRIRNKLVHVGDDYLVQDVENPNEFANEYIASVHKIQGILKARKPAAATASPVML